MDRTLPEPDRAGLWSTIGHRISKTDEKRGELQEREEKSGKTTRCFPPLRTSFVSSLKSSTYPICLSTNPLIHNG